MGSSLCVNCTIKTEESDMQAFPQVQQITFECAYLQEIAEISMPQEQQQQQPETDTSKNVASPQLRGILKHNFQPQQDLGNFCEDNQLPTITIQKKKVKFRKPSKFFQKD
ncbi:unnamed protein product (macronuclear) [Paramecium tetraurelia]|uniref:Uncharacterized protein n=1 Tax=Paramecium tetraurelia TaxID=5888 RepID=A0D2N2_PARTE|nr:uncharacterized protein GSPATT00012807001 [Paramecium tetraurelia]CAK77299.1 unnamed protein product [Paramecium tetraurelia]|eukprot:XP_001444696.1 hypothetical protein (macronuclear) [Paramecium tetraurelia strain d4-2]